MSYVYCGWLDSALKWILNNIISPVFNCIKSVLSTVFSYIYNNILGPILDKTVYALGRWIWNLILDAFFKALYALAKMALQILDCLSDIFDTLLGVQTVIFKGEETTLLRAFLNMDGVRRAFWYINFFALGLAVIFAIYGVTRSMLDFDFENKRPVSRVMSSLLSSVLNLFTVQLAVFGIIYLAEAILTGLNSAMALAGGEVGNTTLGRMIFVLGTLNAANDASYNLSSDAVQSGSKIVGPTDEIRRKFFETSGLSPYKLSDVQTYFNIRKLDYIVIIGLGLVFSFLLLIALISVVRRLFNLLLLYIVSPLFAATIPLDDGEHFGKWRNLFVGTCFTGYGMLVAMKLYLLICPTIMGSEITMSGSVELNFVCKVVFLLGGLWAVYKSSSMITGLISAEAGGAEQESMGKGFEVASWAGANMIKALKSGNKDKDKDKDKEGKDGKEGQEGEGSQRFDGKNSGAAGSTEHGKDNAFQGDMRGRNDKLEGAGKKDSKNKNSNLFNGKAKPDLGRIGRTGAENRTMDKLRNQFDMNNAGGLDKANKAEAEQNKDKNAFQGRRGKTTDSRGLGAKSMDAMRSKFGFDTAPKAAGTADAQKESEAEQALNGQNKSGIATGAVGGKQGKLEGNKSGAQKTGGVAAAGAGGSRAKDDSGYMEMHDTLPKQNVTDAGRFSGMNQGGLDNADLGGKNRPNLNDEALRDVGKAANTAAAASGVAPAQGGAAQSAPKSNGMNMDNAGRGQAFGNGNAGESVPGGAAQSAPKSNGMNMDSAGRGQAFGNGNAGEPVPGGAAQSAFESTGSLKSENAAQVQVPGNAKPDEASGVMNGPEGGKNAFAAGQNNVGKPTEAFREASGPDVGKSDFGVGRNESKVSADISGGTEPKETKNAFTDVNKADSPTTSVKNTVGSVGYAGNVGNVGNGVNKNVGNYGTEKPATDAKPVGDAGQGYFGGSQTGNNEGPSVGSNVGAGQNYTGKPDETGTINGTDNDRNGFGSGSTFATKNNRPTTSVNSNNDLSANNVKDNVVSNSNDQMFDQGAKLNQNVGPESMTFGSTGQKGSSQSYTDNNTFTANNNPSNTGVNSPKMGDVGTDFGLNGQPITQEQYLNPSQKTTSETTEQNGVSQSYAGSNQTGNNQGATFASNTGTTLNNNEKLGGSVPVGASGVTGEINSSKNEANVGGNTFDNKQTFVKNDMGSQSYTGVTNNNQSINNQINAGSNNTYNGASTMFNQNQTNYVNNTNNRNSIGGETNVYTGGTNSGMPKLNQADVNNISSGSGTNVQNNLGGSSTYNNISNSNVGFNSVNMSNNELNMNKNEIHATSNNNVVDNRFTISNESKDVQNNTFEMNSSSYGNINSLGEVNHYTDNESSSMSENQFVDNGDVDYNNMNFSQGINEEIRTGANYTANEGSIHETVRVNRVQKTDAFTVESSRSHVETSMETHTNDLKNETEKIHENAKKESNKKDDDKK